MQLENSIDSPGISHQLGQSENSVDSPGINHQLGQLENSVDSPGIKHQLGQLENSVDSPGINHQLGQCLSKNLRLQDKTQIRQNSALDFHHRLQKYIYKRNIVAYF